MARRARGRNKTHMYLARTVICTCILLIMVLVYLVAIILVDTKINPSPRIAQSESFLDGSSLPDIAEMMSWGHGGSGVITDSRQLRENKEESDSMPNFPSTVWIPPRSAKEKIQLGYARYGLNEFVSNMISLRRALPDMRESACRARKPPGSNPQGLHDASVIIVFQQEPRSVLLRAVFSVLDRSPPELLKEIVLVDAGSVDRDLSYPQLENYLKAASKKIMVVREEVTMNYAQAVNLGVTVSTGKKVVVLSARSECTQDWLQPLLFWLSGNTFSAVVPIVDVIDGNTFRYERTPMSKVTLGSFSWDMTITRRKIKKRKKSDYATPEYTPVIADGIFAMDRLLFSTVDGLMSKLSSRNLVHLEFSFKFWLGGGSIQLVPCSRIGLVSLASAESLGETEENVKEKVVVAETWLGNFKAFAYERLDITDAAVTLTEIDDLNPLDSEMGFRTFQWFLERLEPNKLIRHLVLGSGRLSQGDNLALTVNEEGENGGELAPSHSYTDVPRVAPTIQQYVHSAPRYVHGGQRVSTVEFFPHDAVSRKPVYFRHVGDPDTLVTPSSWEMENLPTDTITLFIDDLTRDECDQV